MSIFKKFILVGFLFLGFAIVAVCALWLYIQNIPSNSFSQPEPAVSSEAVPSVVEEASVPSITESIPVTELPLTDIQKKAAETVGIDTDTFEITSAMISCAGEKLSTERIIQITDGDSPTALEMLKLAPCLVAN